MAMLRSLLILLVVFAIVNAAVLEGGDQGDHKGNDHGGDGHGNDGGDHGGNGHGNDGGDHGGDSHGSEGGDHGGDSHGSVGGDHRGDSHGSVGGDHGGDSHGSDGGDHGGDSHGSDGGDHGGDSHRSDGGDHGGSGHVWDSHGGHSGCPSGWKNFEGQCYKHFSQRVNWIKAERSCQNLGGHLASVSDESENDFLLSLVPTSSRCWIGANDAVQDGEWLWSDGSSSSHRNWCSGEPNNYGGREDCVELSFTGNRCWNDVSCSTMMGYICAMNP